MDSFRSYLQSIIINILANIKLYEREMMDPKNNFDYDKSYHQALLDVASRCINQLPPYVE